MVGPRLALLGIALLALPRLASAAPATLARAHLLGAGAKQPAPLVFFLAIDAAPGAVAVGAAHACDRTRRAESRDHALVRADGGGPVGVAQRYYAAPGRPFHHPGATPRDDFMVFALTAPPAGVRVLRPAEALPRPGDRVRIVGSPASGGGEAELTGRVVESSPQSIEVDLDAPPDLRGWGGAPVFAVGSDRVLGMLQLARPVPGGLRVGIGPIGGVVAAMTRPYEGGLGRLFATMAPPPSAATGVGERRRAVTRSPFGDVPAEQSAAEARAAAAARAGPPVALGEPPPIGLVIEQPAPEAILGDGATGAYVAGRALAVVSGHERFDVVVVIDTSASTAQPSGVDVDGDGEVGKPLAAEPKSPLDLGSTDPGDSILAAEVAAARRLLEGLDPRTTRVGLVTFAGEPVGPVPPQGRPAEVVRAAFTQQPLSSDYRRLEHALDDVAGRPARGMTYMAAGLDLATVELLGLEGAVSAADPESEKFVLFFTDGTPTLPFAGPRAEAPNVQAVLAAAGRARDAGVRVYAFAIGPEALEGPVSTVEMAAITRGLFTPVRDPGTLVRLVEGVRLAEIEAVEVSNATTGQPASVARLFADGAFDALVPLAVGRNELRVRARSVDGRVAEESVLVHYAPGAARPYLPVELVPRRNALLQRRLIELREDRIASERERVQRELRVEIERERAAAEARAAEQRKELHLEVEGADP